MNKLNCLLIQINKYNNYHWWLLKEINIINMYLQLYVTYLIAFVVATQQRKLVVCVCDGCTLSNIYYNHIKVCTH